MDQIEDFHASLQPDPEARVCNLFGLCDSSDPNIIKLLDVIEDLKKQSK